MGNKIPKKKKNLQQTLKKNGNTTVADFRESMTALRSFFIIISLLFIYFLVKFPYLKHEFSDSTPAVLLLLPIPAI